MLHSDCKNWTVITDLMYLTLPAQFAMLGNQMLYMWPWKGPVVGSYKTDISAVKVNWSAGGF